MTPQPSLTDGVVWLTPFRREDGAAIGDFNLDDDHRRWFDQPPVDPDPAARRRHGEEVVDRWQRGWTTQEELTFAVRLAPDGDAIGMAELRPEPEGRAGISYSIVPAHRRRGYATRAVRLLSDAGLAELGFRGIELRCDVENVASARTAERAGFTFERIDPDAGLFEHVEGWGDGPRGERVYRRLRTRSTG
jgi:RimJ/RimL family protein N-acetyltransferase